jgi:predicted regulator of Ras-like GTPase activity (Roadblock/LC7/MglB family)
VAALPGACEGCAMSDRYAAATHGVDHRSARLQRVLSTLLSQAPEMEAAAVVSFDGLPMASALPMGLDEDRVAAMSAALLSLGERAAQGLGRGDLSQVYVEGEQGTVFLVSADDEAVLVAVGARGAKVGLLLFEVRQAAEAVALTLRHEPDPQPEPTPAPQPAYQPQPVQPQQTYQPQPQVPQPTYQPQPRVEPPSQRMEPGPDHRPRHAENGARPEPQPVAAEPSSWS